MEHRTLDEIRSVAQVIPFGAAPWKMSRRGWRHACVALRTRSLCVNYGTGPVSSCRPGGNEPLSFAVCGKEHFASARRTGRCDGCRRDLSPSELGGRARWPGPVPRSS